MRPKFRTNCRMRQPKVGPNKTEQAYMDEIESAKRDGLVQWYGFERIKFRLADKTFYTPDFLMMLADGTLRVVEVKGHWEDDARVKIKVAAEQYPFIEFIAVKPKAKRDGGGWAQEAF
jgi:hypothetical protein